MILLMFVVDMILIHGGTAREKDKKLFGFSSHVIEQMLNGNKQGFT